MHTPNPPLGLAYIAGAVKQAGFLCTVIDGTGEALDSISQYPDRTDFMIQGLSLEKIVARIPPETRIIGLACMFSTLWPLVRELAKSIRHHHPDIPIVLGGEHGTAVPDLVLRHSPIDAVVLGEGEETFISLIRKVIEGQEWRNLPGLAVHQDGEVRNNGLSVRIRTVDELPLPDWDAFPIEQYISRHQSNGINIGRSMPILSTRGCPYQCTFCSNVNMWTTRYVTRDPVKVVDEMELYHNKYNIINFDFQDLTAVVKRQWVVAFCNELIRRDLTITWQMPSGTRSEVFDEEVADLLFKSGCRALAFAPESGSAEILRSIKKQVDIEHMLKAMKIAVKRNFRLSCFIVIGFPDDTPETLRLTLSLIRRMALIGVHDVAVTKFVPYPGSILFRQLQQDGVIQLDDRFFVSPMDFYTSKAPSYSPALTAKRLYWTMLWFFTNFYVLSFLCHPFRTARILLRAVLTGTEETRFAKWLNDVLFTRRKWRKLSKSVGT